MNYAKMDWNKYAEDLNNMLLEFKEYRDGDEPLLGKYVMVTREEFEKLYPWID